MMIMKHLRETFTDEEFADMQKGKDYVQMTWHDLLFAILTNDACLEIIFEEQEDMFGGSRKR